MALDSITRQLLRSVADRLNPPQDPHVNDPAGWVAERVPRGFLWSKQRQIAESVRDHRYTAVPSCHAAGKALDLDTPLPTPTGWTTMREVRSGDELLDEAGQPCRVIAVSPVHHRPAFRVRFDDRSEIVASDDHQWQAHDFRARNRLRQRGYARGHVIDYRDHWDETATVRTTDLAALRHGGQTNWSVPACQPLAGTTKALPVPPYTLGAWLGDGSSADSSITLGYTDAVEIVGHIQAEGVATHQVPSRMLDTTGLWWLEKLNPKLRELGVLRAKHIPSVVLRADVPTRLAVLQGLMDTDGWVAKGSSVGLDLCSERLAADAAELVRTFGWKAFTSTKPAKIDGRIVGTVYRLNFTPDRVVFRLTRKARSQRLPTRQSPRRTQRMVTSVEPVGVRAVKCVMVDSARRLYLAGRDMVPTHNSQLAAYIILWWIACHPPGEAVVVTTAPTFRQVRAILWRYVGRTHTAAKLPGRVTQTEWHLDHSGENYRMPRAGEELVAFGSKPADQDPSAFQGIHARYVLVVVDEAGGVEGPLWDAIDSLVTNDDCRVLAIGNPDNPQSHFAGICKSPLWNTIHISALDTPNLTGEPVPEWMRTLIVTSGWVEERKRDWGETSPVYVAKVLGQFPVDASDGVIPYSAVQACRRELPAAATTPVELGVDVGASSDGDQTVVRERCGQRLGRVWRYREANHVKLAASITAVIRETGATKVKIDSTGVGHGIADILTDGYVTGRHRAEVCPVNFGAAAREPQRYANVRAELHWGFRELVAGYTLDLSALNSEPGSDGVVSELCATRWTIDGTGRTRVEEKSEVRKRLGRSPDDTDAILLAWYQPQTSWGWASY